MGHGNGRFKEMERVEHRLGMRGLCNEFRNFVISSNIFNVARMLAARVEVALKRNGFSVCIVF